MQIKYTLKFYPNKYTQKNGKCTIYGRIRHKQKKSEFATHLRIDPSQWNDEFMQPVNNPYIKRELAKIEADIQSTVMKLQIEQIHIDSKSIKDYYTGKHKLDMGVMEYVERIIQIKKKSTSISNSNKYLGLKKYLQNFIRSEYQTKDIALRRVDHQFLVHFDAYLKSTNSKQYKQPLQPITISKKHEYFRAVLKQALNEGLIKKSPYQTFKISKPIPIPKSLNKDELMRIEELDLSGNETLDRVRDVFLFSVYSGFRFGDAQNLTMDNIIISDGKYDTFYLRSQQKNDLPVHIPILPKAEKIIRKYEHSSERLILNRVLPKLSNAYFNRKIKEIAKMCNIKMNLHHHIARHTFATTILMENGVSIYEAQKWMGHSSIDSTKVYSQITFSRLKTTTERLAKVL